MRNRILKYLVCLTLAGCSVSNKELDLTKDHKSLFTIDTIRKYYPNYLDSVSYDLPYTYAHNYKGKFSYEILSFDSIGNYKRYLRRYSEEMDIYEAEYDDSLNTIKEKGSLMHLKIVDCFEKDTPNLFMIYPATPPFFKVDLKIFYKDSTLTSYEKIVDKTIEDDKNILFGKRSFVSGGEFLGVLTMTRDNYERRDTFELQFFNCESTRPQ